MRKRSLMLGVVLPVWVQNEGMLKLTYEAVASWKSSVPARAYVVTNRLHGVTPGEFYMELTKRCAFEVNLLHEDGVERSVAGAWNHGLNRAMSDGCHQLLIASNDSILQPDCIDRLLDYTTRVDRAAIWSALDTRDRKEINKSLVTEGSNFSCVMLTPDTIEKVGWFDERFKPAYFEDNDYAARVWLSGLSCACVHAAQFFHHGSMTTRLDSEAKHHVSHWWDANAKRFRDKWGHGPMEREDVMKNYHRTPWNDPSLSLKDWDRA